MESSQGVIKRIDTQQENGKGTAQLVEGIIRKIKPFYVILH